MGIEVFSLKWNSHRDTFFDVLATARAKKKFCDATIACEGNLYPVHRFVLSTCSTYFDRILENLSDTHPVILLADIKTKDIEDLLQYMYTGEVKVLQEDIDSLIKAGEVLKIKGIGVSDEIEKPKKKKRFFDDSKETFEKRQRTDEFGDNSRLNEAAPESKTNKEANVSFEDCNEDTNGIGGFLHHSKQPISESTPVKEELLVSVDDPLNFPEHNVKVEFSEPLIEEEDLQLAENGNFERTTDSFLEQESNHFHDASTSSISLARNMHLDWIMQNDQSQERMPLTGMCLVCGDKGSGYHYGIETCGGCNCFFKRSIKNNIGMNYDCVLLRGNCDISRENRGSRTCKACRFQKCIASGMNMNNVKKSLLIRKGPDVNDVQVQVLEY